MKVNYYVNELLILVEANNLSQPETLNVSYKSEILHVDQAELFTIKYVKVRDLFSIEFYRTLRF